MVSAELVLRREVDVSPFQLAHEYAAARNAADEVVAYARSRGFDVRYGHVGAAFRTDLGDAVSATMEVQNATPADESPPGP